MRLLCVEPTKAYRRLLDAAFDEAGISAEFCATGQDALKHLHASDGFDFITVSFYLEDVTAIELIKSIRSDDRFRYTPISLITSESSEEILHRALGVGVTDIFRKDEIETLVIFLSRFNRNKDQLDGRVLCIEDTLSQQQMMKAQLESIGLNVDCCENLDSAWQLFTANDYDLVITDIVFEKDLGGIKLVNNIRRYQGEKGDVPILAMSAFDDPVRRIEILNRGANEYISKPILEEELIARVRGLIANKKYIDAFKQEQVERRRELEVDLVRHQNYDQLTSLYNRTMFMEQLAQDVSRATRLGLVGAVLYVDLDNFKNINDLLGHQIGDGLLKQVAERLNSIRRDEDIIARLGGDDFVILLTEIGRDNKSAGDFALHFAKQIQALFKAPFSVLDQEVETQTSVGITLYPTALTNVYDILKQADAARYQAKSSGKNSVAFYSEELQGEVDERARIENWLRHAISNKELYLNFQPVFENGKSIIGCEALLRWRLSNGEQISPGVFIPIAENSGLMEDIGEWVMKESFLALKRWNDGGLPGTFKYIAINCSARQFKMESFVADIKALVEKIGVSPQQIELEITETLLMEDLVSMIHKMHQLRELGFRFSIDDFGTGFSSLRYLKQLPIDKLKIDQSFVRDIATDSNDLAIVETVIGMAHTMNISVVAEGVETQEQSQLLLDRNCQLMQGYLFSRPISELDFIELAKQKVAAGQN